MLILLTLVLCMPTVFSYENCFKLDVSITQKVENEGFHRKIFWLLEIQSPELQTWINSFCNMALLLNINAGMFVNTDEIAELNRMSQSSVLVVGDVNVETPAHESTGHLAYIFVPNINRDKISLSLPIHLRYQRSQITGGFGKVRLSKPSLLATCPNGPSQICGQISKIYSAPCHVFGDEMCKWQNITYQTLFEEVELFVPIGDLDDYPLVSIVTLLLGCAGCIYVLSILSTAPL